MLMLSPASNRQQRRITDSFSRTEQHVTKSESPITLLSSVFVVVNQCVDVNGSLSEGSLSETSESTNVQLC